MHTDRNSIVAARRLLRSSEQLTPLKFQTKNAPKIPTAVLSPVMQSRYDTCGGFDTLKSDSVASIVSPLRSPDIGHNFINSHRVHSNGLLQRSSDTTV